MVSGAQARAADDACFFAFLRGFSITWAAGGVTAGCGAGAGDLTVTEATTGCDAGATGAAGGTTAEGTTDAEFMEYLLLAV